MSRLKQFEERMRFYAAEADALTKEVARLKAQQERLADALAPFAAVEFGPQWEKSERSPTLLGAQPFQSLPVTYDDFLRARSALAEVGEPQP